MIQAHKESYIYQNFDIEIAVYRAKEDGQLRGYISAGGFSDLIIEMSGDLASDMKNLSGKDPVSELVAMIKNEIESGKFKFGNDT